MTTVRLSVVGANPQLIRFAVAGLGVTALSALVYLALSTSLLLPPLLANTVSHLTGVAAGFAIHSRWSFRDDARADGPARFLRFAAGSGASYALNSLWVWTLVTAAGAPVWAPVPAMLCLTPLASFAINRWWVFARR